MKKPSHLTLIALRHSSKHPIQSLLLILGVALGVAMIIAIDLANSSASQAFALSTDSIAGRATHQLVGTTSVGVPETLYKLLRVEHGYRNIAPIVTGPAVLIEADERPLRLLGVDPFAEAPFRNYLGAAAANEGPSLAVLTSLIVEPGTILLSQNLGESFNLQPGDMLTLLTDGQTTPVKLVGLLQPSDDLSQRAIADLILTDISTAQELLNQTGHLSHIDLILPPDDSSEGLTALLPDNVQLQRARLRNETVDQLTAAFALNLTALSLLGVVVGMFLIYNTISFSVVQRRPVLGVLRCLGVTRREIFGLVLTEALVLSAIGTVIGLGLGIFLGRGLVVLVTQTINDLFFNLTVQSVMLDPITLYKGIAAGLGAGLLAAAIPALEATTIPPVIALKRSTVESRVQQLIPWLSLGGGLLILLGGGLLLWPSQSAVISFAALFLVVIGIALLTPLITQGFMTILNGLIGDRANLVSRMAIRSIVRALSRTSVTIAALMIAVSVIIGVSVMINSFRGMVIDWLNTLLVADIFISPTGLNSKISAEFVAAISQEADVAQIALARITSVYAPAYGPVELRAFSDATTDSRTFLWAEGGADQALVALGNGDILVSEVFARQNKLPLNQVSQFTLVTDMGERSFRVAGVFYDYNPQGFILMHLPNYRQYWADETISNVALYLTEATNADQTAAALQAKYAAQYQISIVSNQGLKESALTVFDRTFTITLALRLLATLVAFIGVLSALMSLQLEKTRELATLRANGMTLPQLWQLTFVETGLMGLTAGLIAMPAGIVMATILIYVINLRSFGWSLQLQLPPQAFLFAVTVAVGASLIAGIYPAIRLGKMAIAVALREA